MMHKTLEHIEQISICWDFTAGYCPFGDEKCWFRHTVFPSTEVRCKICDDKFLTKSDYQKHKKQKHPELVPRCNEVTNGNICKYGIHCWFKHKEHEEHEITNNEAIENKDIEK